MKSYCFMHGPITCFLLSVKQISIFREMIPKYILETFPGKNYNIYNSYSENRTINLRKLVSNSQTLKFYLKDKYDGKKVKYYLKVWGFYCPSQKIDQKSVEFDLGETYIALKHFFGMIVHFHSFYFRKVLNEHKRIIIDIS